MILPDTSAWISYLRDDPRADAIDRLIVDGTAACTEPVLMEVLAGARTEQDEQHIRRLLVRNAWLPCDAVADFEGAASVYRAARRTGITPGSHMDCMIVAIAARTSTPLLTFDRQQAQVAALAGVTVLAS